MEDKKFTGGEPVFSLKLRAGRKRTYFIDVRETKQNDYYISMTESKKKMDGSGYDRHKIYVYKEDLNVFLKSLTEAIDHVKGLMPNYDFDEFTKKQEEYEKMKAEQIANGTWDPSKQYEQKENQGENFSAQASPAPASESYPTPSESTGSAPLSDNFSSPVDDAPRQSTASDDELKW